ncbi:MAG: ATP-binding protein [Syntrophorhabdales bacterium]
MDRPMRILVIDDERGIREGCRRALEPEGYAVEVAAGGKEGLERVRSKQFDLLLIDLMMPTTGGIEMMEHVRAHDPEIIMIVIAALATVETALDAMRHGASDYLPKPFEPDELLAVVARGAEMRRLRLRAGRLMKKRDRRPLDAAHETSKLHAVINSMADGILVFNREKQLALWNPAAVRMLDLDGRLEAGRAVGEIIANKELAAMIGKAYSAQAARCTMQSGELELRGPKRRTVMVSLSVVRDESGRDLGVVGVLHDITRRTEIDRIKSQFVSMVAHELRAPLGAIEGYLSAFLTGAAGSDPEVNRRMLERAKARTHSLLDLVSDLLQLIRLESIAVVREKALLDVRGIVTGTVELLKGQGAEKGLRFKVDIPESLPFIEADRAGMEQLFTNLISNAIKYNVTHGKVIVTARAGNHFLTIKVADTGVGIDAEELPHIYDEFYRVPGPQTRHAPGTGLGLSIVKKIVESHFGRIEVNSKVNKGTTFTVKLPTTQASEARRQGQS